MVIKTFVAKVSRILNNKGKGYFVYRMNIPYQIVEELQLSEKDYILVKAQKAKWYHFLDWADMKKTWTRLPADVRSEIEKSGVIEEQVSSAPAMVSTNAFVVAAECFAIASGTSATGISSSNISVQGISQSVEGWVSTR